MLDVATGEAIGCGRVSWPIAPRDSGRSHSGMRRTATRATGDGTAVVVDKQRAALIGRVWMDMLTVDLTELTSAGIGSEVELWGPNAPIAYIVAPAGTTAYKLLCNAKRAPRATEPRLLVEGSVVG